MLVPAITIDALEVEGMVILPPEICGLVVGDLNIPALNLLLLEIPEIEIPEYEECPFYVSVPLPVKYASSAYPMYEIDAMTPTLEILSVRIIGASYSDSISVNLDVLSVASDGYRYVTTYPELDVITVGLDVLSGEIVNYGYVIVSEAQLDAISVGVTVLSGETVDYRYIVTVIEPHAISVGLTILNGEII